MLLSEELVGAIAEDEGGDFEVRWALVLDHPEKRDSSFAPSTAKRVGHTRSFKKKAPAMAYAKSLIAGDDDFASEYPSNVTVVQLQQGKSSRFLLKPVRRERQEDGTVKTVRAS